MNTQNLLHDRSSEIPEGLYIELMNKLKIDFDQNQQTKTKILIINKSLPTVIARSKHELIIEIVQKSSEWNDCEEVLLKISNKRVMFSEVKKICITHGIKVSKQNPRWTNQNNLYGSLRHASGTIITTI